MRKQGFTLVELAIIIVIIGILAAVAVPAFVSLTAEARQSATDAGLGAIKSAIYIRYAENAVTTGCDGAACFPATIVAGDFADGIIPENANNQQSGIGAGACGGTDGWNYVAATGVVTACP